MKRKYKPWTMKEISFLQENAGEYTDHEFAEILDRTYRSVRAMRYKLGLPAKKAIYEVSRGNEVLARGTAEECAEQLGVSKKTVTFLTTPSYLKKRKNLEKSMIAVRVN